MNIPIIFFCICHQIGAPPIVALYQLQTCVRMPTKTKQYRPYVKLELTFDITKKEGMQKRGLMQKEKNSKTDV